MKHWCITSKTIFRLVGSNGSSPIKTVEGLSASARSSASPPKPTATKVNQGDDARTAPAPADISDDDDDLDEFEEEERRLLALETQVPTSVSSTFFALSFVPRHKVLLRSSLEGAMWLCCCIMSATAHKLSMCFFLFVCRRT